VTTSTWSFRGAPFERKDPAGQARTWPAELQITVDVVAGDVGATPRRYVDIGAVVHEPWAFTAGCASAAARDALIALRYTSGTLTTIGGASYQALLIKAVPLTHDGSGSYEAELRFELLS
jgi:hypothetical protein